MSSLVWLRDALCASLQDSIAELIVRELEHISIPVSVPQRLAHVVFSIERCEGSYLDGLCRYTKVVQQYSEQLERQGPKLEITQVLRLKQAISNILVYLNTSVSGDACDQILVLYHDYRELCTLCDLPSPKIYDLFHPDIQALSAQWDTEAQQDADGFLIEQFDICHQRFQNALVAWGRHGSSSDLTELTNVIEDVHALCAKGMQQFLWEALSLSFKLFQQHWTWGEVPTATVVHMGARVDLQLQRQLDGEQSFVDYNLLREVLFFIGTLGEVCSPQLAMSKPLQILLQRYDFPCVLEPCGLSWLTFGNFQPPLNDIRLTHCFEVWLDCLKNTQTEFSSVARCLADIQPQLDMSKIRKEFLGKLIRSLSSIQVSRVYYSIFAIEITLGLLVLEAGHWIFVRNRGRFLDLLRDLTLRLDRLEHGDTLLEEGYYHHPLLKWKNVLDFSANLPELLERLSVTCSRLNNILRSSSGGSERYFLRSMANDLTWLVVYARFPLCMEHSEQALVALFKYEQSLEIPELNHSFEEQGQHNPAELHEPTKIETEPAFEATDKMQERRSSLKPPKEGDFFSCSERFLSVQQGLLRQLEDPQIEINVPSQLSYLGPAAHDLIVQARNCDLIEFSDLAKASYQITHALLSQGAIDRETSCYFLRVATSTLQGWLESLRAGQTGFNYQQFLQDISIIKTLQVVSLGTAGSVEKAVDAHVSPPPVQCLQQHDDQDIGASWLVGYYLSPENEVKEEVLPSEVESGVFFQVMPKMPVSLPMHDFIPESPPINQNDFASEVQKQQTEAEEKSDVPEVSLQATEQDEDNAETAADEQALDADSGVDISRMLDFSLDLSQDDPQEELPDHVLAIPNYGDLERVDLEKAGLDQPFKPGSTQAGDYALFRSGAVGVFDFLSCFSDKIFRVLALNRNGLKPNLKTLSEIMGIVRETVGKLNADLKCLNIESVYRLRLLDSLQDVTARCCSVLDELECLVLDVSRQSGLVNALQCDIWRFHLQPFRTLSDDLNRAVSRKLASADLDKQATLVISGGEVELSLQALDGLFPVLLILLDNAVAHGIESTPVRISKQKGAIGQISLLAIRQKKYVMIIVMDDGSGLDMEGLFAQAKKNGWALSHENPDNISSARLSEWLLERGLSRTAASASDTTETQETGLVAAARLTQALGGSLSVVNMEGYGCRFVIKLLDDVVWQRLVVVGVMGALYGIEAELVEECFHLSASAVSLAYRQGGLTVKQNEKKYPIYRLSTLLHGSQGETLLQDHSEQRMAVMLLRDAAGQQVALQVGQLLGCYTMHTRAVSGQPSTLSHVSAVCVNQEGDSVLVLDPFVLLDQVKVMA